MDNIAVARLLEGIETIPKDALLLGCVRVIGWLDPNGDDHVTIKFDGDQGFFNTIGMLEAAKYQYLEATEEVDDD